MGRPPFILRGYRVGQAHGRSPQILTEKGPSIRNDFTYGFNRGGRHDLNMGAEYVYSDQPIFLGINSNGTLDAAGRARFRPTSSSSSPCGTTSRPGISTRSARLPGSTRWPSATSSRTTRSRAWPAGCRTTGRWARLTLNLGVRYDIIKGTYGEERGFDPWLQPDRPLDKNNIQPRARLRLQRQRSHGHARRLGAVLWRRHRRGPCLLHRDADHQRAGEQRRAARTLRATRSTVRFRPTSRWSGAGRCGRCSSRCLPTTR